MKRACAFAMAFLILLTTAPVFAADAPAKQQTCCQKAKADGKTCSHKCCVTASKAGKTCEKCNPPTKGAAAKR